MSLANAGVVRKVRFRFHDDQPRPGDRDTIEEKAAVVRLVSLSPNVSTGFSTQGQAGARQGGIRAAQTISVAGQRTNFNHHTLDGVESTDPNFNTFVVMPSVDALQEFKVQTGFYPAEFGHTTTQINVLTKSGTNQYHGSAFEFLRNDKLDATSYAFTSLRPVKDPFKWNQYGFTLGGRCGCRSS